jgi:integrase/recombinase XerD
MDIFERYDREIQRKADSEQTASIRKSDVNQFAGWIKETRREFPTNGSGIQREHALLIEDYLFHLQKEGFARGTIESRWQSLKDFYKRITGDLRFDDVALETTPFEIIGARREYLPPKERGHDKRTQMYVTKEQKEKLCENVRSPSFRNELVVRLMWQTGIRSGELCELQIDEVNLGNNRLERFWRPKTKDHHTVSFGEPVAWMLEEFIDGGYRDAFEYSSHSEFLFPTHEGKQMHRTLPNRIIVNAAKDAGIQETVQTDQQGNDRNSITSHAMRRGHGMHLWKNGVDLHTIRQRLGHTSIEQTQDYLPIDDEDVTEKIAGVDW